MTNLGGKNQFEIRFKVNKTKVCSRHRAEPPCGCELCVSLKRSELMRPNVITSQSGRGKSMLFHMFFFFISSSFDPAVIPQIDLLQAETCLGMGLLTRADVVRGGKQAVDAQISCQKMCAHEAPTGRCVVCFPGERRGGAVVKNHSDGEREELLHSDCEAAGRGLILDPTWKVLVNELSEFHQQQNHEE